MDAYQYDRTMEKAITLAGKIVQIEKDLRSAKVARIICKRWFPDSVRDDMEYRRERLWLRLRHKILSDALARVVGHFRDKEEEDVHEGRWARKRTI